MTNQYNPFKDNRAEQMRDLWKYYVPISVIDESGKPVVVEGGRGSGKTMLFQCNSWRQVLSQLEKQKCTISKMFEMHSFIGIYYRVDTTFVASMSGRDNKNWPAVFETYFSICILQEVLDMLIVLNEELLFNQNSIKNFVHSYSKRFNPNSNSEDLSQFRNETEDYLDRIEDFINGASRIDMLRLVKAHRLIKELCISCNKLLGKDILYKIFIDEYETLLQYQQRIVNTLIKHSTLPVIFNIGMRPEGMKTRQTISKTEIIEPPNDYQQIHLRIDTNRYLEILREICRKRICLGKELGKIPETAPEEIEYYLGNYNIDDEIESIVSSINIPLYISELREIIKKRGTKEKLDDDFINECISTLCDLAPPLNSRLHYILLNKKTHYTPTVKDLYDAYVKKNKKYMSWMHNMKFGIVFLLAKDYEKVKMYYGFDVFAALSSNIVRYFLELCEHAFRIAFLDDYNWNKPIDPTIQAEAAKYVSEYKIVDIESYEPFGKELRIFVQFLGLIFNKLHISQFTTLGEPEPNHFYTKDLTLSASIKKLLSSAIMWNVLQTGEPTKRKQSMFSPETVDYYLNKIYVPYFGISYRNKRKIQINVQILEGLLSGDADVAKQSFHQYFKILRTMYRYPTRLYNN